MIDNVVIPAAPDELGSPETAVRLPGQSFGNPVAQFSKPTAAGHKADDDSFSRSKNKVYKRKITKQKARMK